MIVISSCWALWQAARVIQKQARRACCALVGVRTLTGSTGGVAFLAQFSGLIRECSIRARDSWFTSEIHEIWVRWDLAGASVSALRTIVHAWRAFAFVQVFSGDTSRNACSLAVSTDNVSINAGGAHFNCGSLA